MDKIIFPHVFAKHANSNNEKALSSRGVLGKDGKWIVDCGFLVDKLDIGTYRITHGWGYQNTSLNVSILESPGTAKILEHHTNYFVVQTLVDKVPTDKEFVFVLVKVI